MKVLQIILFLMVIASCNSVNQTTDKPKIVTTTGMLYDAAFNIAGDSMEVEALMGPGVDPHLYKATQGDLSKLRNADIIIYNGLLLEGKMGDILKKLNSNKLVIAAAESVPESLRRASHKYENAYDPHVWFDVNLWKLVVDKIGETIILADPKNKAYYEQNLQQHLDELTKLDQYVTSKVNEIPSEKRILVTAHDAFGYFGNAYGIRVEGIQGLSTVADFGLRDIAEISQLITDNGISAIFVETSVSDKAIRAVIDGCRAKGYDISVGGSLFSDAMGEIGTPEGTYIGMFKSNVNTIVNELKGSKPTQ